MRGGRRGFFIPGQIGTIIEAVLLLVFVGLFIFGGALAGDAVSEFLKSAAETNLEAFRDEVEYGCRAGERTGDPVSDDYEFKETIVEVRTVDGGARYEATLESGDTISVENNGCDEVHICSGSVGVDCTEGTLSGGFVQMDLLFQDTGGESDPDVLWIAQTNRDSSGDGGSGNGGTTCGVPCMGSCVSASTVINNPDRYSPNYLSPDCTGQQVCVVDVGFCQDPGTCASTGSGDGEYVYENTDGDSFCGSQSLTPCFIESTCTGGTGDFRCGGTADNPAAACGILSTVGVTQQDAREVCTPREGCRWSTSCQQDAGASTPGLQCEEVESIMVESHTNPAGICERISGCSVDSMGPLAGSCTGSMQNGEISDHEICQSIGSQEVCNNVPGCTFDVGSAQCVGDNDYNGDFGIAACGDVSTYSEDYAYSHNGMCGVLPGCSWEPGG